MRAVPLTLRHAAAPLAAALALLGCGPSYDELLTRGHHAAACAQAAHRLVRTSSPEEETRQRVRMSRLALNLADPTRARLSLRALTEAELLRALGALPAVSPDRSLLLVAWHAPPVVVDRRETALVLEEIALEDGVVLHRASWAGTTSSTLQAFGVPEPPARPVRTRSPSALGALARTFFRVITLGLLPGVEEAFARVASSASDLARDTVDRFASVGRAVASVWKREPPEHALRRLAALRHLALVERGTWTLHGQPHRFLQLEGRRPGATRAARPATLGLRLVVRLPEREAGSFCQVEARLQVPLPPGATLPERLAALFPRPRTLAELLAQPGVAVLTSRGHAVPRTPLVAPAR